MAAPAAKAPNAPALEMRLSVPPEGDLNQVAAELAAKIAESLGAAARPVGAILQTLTARVAAPGLNVTYYFRETNCELVIVAQCDGRSAEGRHPLTA